MFISIYIDIHTSYIYSDKINKNDKVCRVYNKIQKKKYKYIDREIYYLPK